MFLGGRPAELMIHKQISDQESNFQSPQPRGKQLRKETQHAFKTVLVRDARHRLDSIDEQSPASPAHYQSKEEYI